MEVAPVPAPGFLQLLPALTPAGTRPPRLPQHRVLTLPWGLRGPLCVTLMEAWDRNALASLLGPLGHGLSPRASMCALGSRWWLGCDAGRARGPRRTSLCLRQQRPGADSVPAHRILIMEISLLSL